MVDFPWLCQFTKFTGVYTHVLTRNEKKNGSHGHRRAGLLFGYEISPGKWSTSHRSTLLEIEQFAPKNAGFQ